LNIANKQHISWFAKVTETPPRCIEYDFSKINDVIFKEEQEKLFIQSEEWRGRLG